MKTRDEIAILLAEKFKKESARLKSWGTKTDEKAAFSFAMAVLEFVRGLMADSRYRELRHISKFIRKNGIEAGDRGLKKYIEERLKATSSMAKAIEKFAIEKEGQRAWKPKKHKHKHRSNHDHKTSRRN